MKAKLFIHKLQVLIKFCVLINLQKRSSGNQNRRKV